MIGDVSQGEMEEYNWLGIELLYIDNSTCNYNSKLKTRLLSVFLGIWKMRGNRNLHDATFSLASYNILEVNMK